MRSISINFPFITDYLLTDSVTLPTECYAIGILQLLRIYRFNGPRSSCFYSNSQLCLLSIFHMLSVCPRSSKYLFWVNFFHFCPQKNLRWEKEVRIKGNCHLFTCFLFRMARWTLRGQTWRTWSPLWTPAANGQYLFSQRYWAWRLEEFLSPSLCYYVMYTFIYRSFLTYLLCLEGQGRTGFS